VVHAVFMTAASREDGQMKGYSRIGITALALALLAGVSSASAAVTFTNTPLESGTLAASYDPETDGRWVVYDSVAILPGAQYNIVARNLKTGDLTSFGGAGNQVQPDVSMDRVVYEHQGASWDVRMYDLREASDIGIATSADAEISPRISGDLVIWLNATDGELWFRNLRSNVSDVVAGPPGAITGLDVDRGCIAYIVDNEYIYTFRPGVDSSPELRHTMSSGEVATALRIHGDDVLISYSDEGNNKMLVLNTTSDLTFNVNPSGAPGSPGGAIFHGSIAWEADMLTSWDVRWEAVPSAGTAGAIDVAATAADERDLSIFGRRIVWEQDTGVGDVYMGSSAPESVRTQGADRYETAARASAAYFDAANNAVLCTGMNFPDALAAAPFAKIVAGPLLLSRSNAVPPSTMDELDRLGVTHVFVIGGTGVLLPAVETQLHAAGMTTERIQGPTRYETANSIAARIVDAGNSNDTYDGTAFFARGDKFPDALAVGPVAAQAGAPIFLVKPTELPATVATAMSNLYIKQGFVIGGEPAVSADVRNDIEAILDANGGPPDPTERWSGADRYATAAAVIKNGLDWRYIDLDTLGLATGENFPDALGGGAALGHYGSGLALTQSGSLPASLIQLLTDQEYKIGRLDVFGGSDVVSDAVMTGVAARLK